MMTKICKICGGIINSDVLEHYREKHFSMYVANRSKIEAHPGAFAMTVGVKGRKPINIKEPSPIYIKKEKVYKKGKSTPITPVKNNYILDALNQAHDEQTYRGLHSFECDGCHKMSLHGKVIFCSPNNLHVCYDCYKNAKQFLNSKRGNKHVFINTPM